MVVGAKSGVAEHLKLNNV